MLCNSSRNRNAAAEGFSACTTLTWRWTDSPLSVWFLLCAAASWIISWARSPSLGPGGMLGERPSRAWFMDRPLWCAAGWREAERFNNCSQTDKPIEEKVCVVWRDARILSEELSVWAGELDTLLLRWDDGWLPGLRWSSRDGAGEGLSGTRSCNPSNNKSTHNPNKYPVKVKQHSSFCHWNHEGKKCEFVILQP